MKTTLTALAALASLTLAAPADAECRTTRVCTEDGCYNDTYCTGGDRSREERNRDDNRDRRDYNRQRNYPEWDERGSREYRKQRSCEAYGDCY